MSLTVKQKMFADYIAHGLNKSAAYKKSYNAQHMNSNSIAVEAHRLSKHPKVLAEVDRIRRAHPRIKRRVPDLSKDWIKMELMDLATSIYSSTTTQVNALKVLSRIKGRRCKS